MTDTTPGEIFVLLEVAFHAEPVAGPFKRRYWFWHDCLAIVAGFTLFNFLPSHIVLHFTARSFAVMAAIAFQPLVVVVR
jgi:ABC-type transport system involved in Fe-S cluster assembly fused permease/ATPase subunit